MYNNLLKFVLASLLLASHAYAGGIILYEISSSDTRLASAGWAARAQDPSTVFTNPAGMTRLCGRQAELGMQPIYTHLSFERGSDSTVSGGNGDADCWLPSGSFFYTQRYNDCLTFGLASIGYFGSYLSYNNNWVGRYYFQHGTLEGYSCIPSAAYKINSQWSVGAGVNVMYGVLRQRSAVNNTLDGLPDGYFTLRDYRFGVGGTAGILYEPTECTRFGVQYVSPVVLNFKAKPSFHDIGPTLNNILDVIGLAGSNVDLKVRVPQSVMISAYHDLNICWSIMGNVGWQQWSRFQQATVTLAEFNERSFRFVPKFKDTWHIAAGAEYHPFEELTFSGGVAYDSSAVSDVNRPLNFPISDQWRLGAGISWLFSEDLRIDFSGELEWQGKFSADVTRGSVAGRVVGEFQNAYALFGCFNVTYAF